MDLNVVSRLTIYVNYGVAGMVFSFLDFQIAGTFSLLLPIVFNSLLFLKLKGTFNRNKLMITGLTSCIITTLFFLIQWEYKELTDWGCITLIPDLTAEISYSSTIILFSLIMWEIGCRLSSPE